MKRLIKIIGIILILVVILLVVVGGYVFARSNSLVYRKWDIDPASIEIPTDEAALAFGQHLFESRTCTQCHGDNGGGSVIEDDPMLMTIYASNLTDGEGGVGQYYTTEDYIRAIQHGVNADGRALVIMPSIDFQQMREEELGALVAYIQTLPPVDNVQPELALGPMGRVLIAFDLAPLLTAYLIDHDNAGVVEVEYGANLEYGAYLAVTCQSCHGQDLTGGLQVGGPSVPPSANITPHEDGIAGWTLDDFITTIRTGINPDGEQLRAPMPWQQLGNMTDEELEAIYLYLQTVDPQPDNE